MLSCGLGSRDEERPQGQGCLRDEETGFDLRLVGIVKACGHWSSLLRAGQAPEGPLLRMRFCGLSRGVLAGSGG